jgi:hypothetical protein
MAVKVSWKDETKSVILFEVYGYYTWADIHAAVEQQHTLMDTVQHKVCTIIDMRNTTLLPSGSLPNLRRLIGQPHAHSATKIIVGANTIIQVIFESAGRTYETFPDEYLFVRTMREAEIALADEPCSEAC